MLSRSATLTALAISSALTASGLALAVRHIQHKRPDVLPVYRPLHRMIEPGPPQQVAVIYNPVKERSDSVKKLITAALEQADWPGAHFYETQEEDPGHGMAKQALEEGAELVLAVGGDGTVRAVATALAGTGVPLGVVPLGTGNLLARNLKLDITDLRACINLALHGENLAVDMIRISFGNTDQLDPVDFIIMGGAGFDAQIMTDTSEDLKAKIGWLAYVEASIRHMFTRRRPAIITVDGAEPIRRKIRSVLIANTGKIQGGLNLASSAEVSDGQLEVIVLTPRTLLSWIRMAGQFIVHPRQAIFPVVEHFVGTEAQVDFPQAPLPVEVDGDVLGETTSLNAKVLPAAVNIKVYPEDLQIRSLTDLLDARQELAAQQKRWWRQVLGL
ncbi:diacylglycerol/lipid kinase family protein [Rothia sp. P5764]|uniref:diacylglycerol/lipid kinase family protein n=1 Tax=Rothia sp. P5764 TaxID=3402654 RepID=UPI003AC9AA54